ncbi:hypothetical protein Z043_118862 [Scleropages formosus]|uniref:Nitric oxide synthase-interacting protein n=1 Tax=Scleropages formosus TaxID=113540 RepID=A0A0P7TNT5_SCLFO|nr:hypothetical protein Z043_118862 [Scleropages formosus]
MKAYEKQKQALKSERLLESRSEQRDKIEKFKTKENSIVSKPINPFTAALFKDSLSPNGSATSTDGSDDGAPSSSSGSASSAKLPSFWIPSLTPEAKPSVLKKPAKTVLCPMSGRPLKLNDLVSVRFTPLDSSLDRVALLTRQMSMMSFTPVNVVFQSTDCESYVSQDSGAVVTMECVEKLIKKDMVDPVSGEELTEKDVIQLQRGGTGFAGSGIELEARESRPVMQA